MNINDSFNRGDQTHLAASGSGWSWSTGNLEVVSGDPTADMGVVSNQCKQNLAGGLVSVRAEQALTNNDNFAQMTIVTRGNGTDGCGVYCRASTGTNPAYYLAYLLEASATLQLYKNTGGASFTQLGSNVTVTIALPQTIRVQAVGTTIKAYYDGVERISVTDSAITTGARAGMRIGAGGSIQRIIDDFRAGDAPEVGDVDFSFGVLIG